jgi:adenosine kinase
LGGYTIMKKNIIISGSLAYDRIMDFSGHFHDHILPDKIHTLNISFQVNGVKEKFGGTAGNIAYALTLLGHKPLISATIGKDYHPYFEWFSINGISTDLIRVIDDELTASAYITTDLSDNQITGWNPGAMKHSSRLDFGKFDPKETMLIISPGNLDDMIQYPKICKDKGIDYIFDPGQSIPMLEASDIISAIEDSMILITNDYELEMIMNKTGLSKTDLLKKTGTVITTLGDSGSLIATLQSEKTIPVTKAKQVLDPTGAGDSFRGGLIAALVEGHEISHCALVGSICASFSVECHGTQDYRFSKDEFSERWGTK